MKIITIALLLVSSGFAQYIPSFSNPPLSFSEIETLIEVSAERHQISSAFIKSIVAAESAFNPNAVSYKGAVGLMQLMPGTAREYGVDPSIVEQNIDAGTRYLKFLITKYRSSRQPLKNAIAAYNAGPGNVDRYRGVPPFRETRGYVARVLSFLKQFGGKSRGADAARIEHQNPVVQVSTLLTCD